MDAEQYERFLTELGDLREALGLVRVPVGPNGHVSPREAFLECKDAAVRLRAGLKRALDGYYTGRPLQTGGMPQYEGRIYRSVHEELSALMKLNRLPVWDGVATAAPDARPQPQEPEGKQDA